MMDKKINDLLWSIAGIMMGLAIVAPLWLLVSMIILVLGE